MKTQLVTIFDMLFGMNLKEKNVENDSASKIFLTDTDISSGRTLMIEEETYAVWAYLLCEDKENIDFDGFLCAVTDPFTSNITPQEITHKKKDAPLPLIFANEYSYVENLKKKDIKVHWEKEYVAVFIKKDLYLVMDTKTRCSYSKGLIKDCDYGMQLKK